MANMCSYEIRVKGSKEARDKFFHYMDYDNQVENEPHFARMQYSSDIQRNEYVNIDGNECDSILGACAWSLYSCMFKGPHTYFNDNKNNLVNIKDVTKELGLEVEMWSEETGMCFCEHYYIKNGEFLLDGCTRLTEKEVEDGVWEYDEKPDNFWQFDYL